MPPVSTTRHQTAEKPHPSSLLLRKAPLSLLYIVILVSSFVCTASHQHSAVVYVSVEPEVLVQGTNLTQVFVGGDSLMLRLQPSASRLQQESCPEDTFAVSQFSRYLYLIRTVNVSASSQAQCVSNGTEQFAVIRTFQCFVVAESPTLSFGTTVVIHVRPNLHNLQFAFTRSSYTATVFENQTNALVAVRENLRAVTTPTVGLVQLQYELLEGATCFGVVRETIGCNSYPKILTTKPLRANASGPVDYITIKAFYASNFALANISIEVIRTNSHPPTFLGVPQNITIPENTSIGTILLQLQATDPDVGVNGEVRFHQVPSVSPLTSVNPVTGELYLISPLNYEAQTHTSVTIIASDLATLPLSTTTTLTIFIANSNEFPPVVHISFQVHPIPESTLAGTPIASVVVSDQDSSNFSLSLASRYCINCFILANELIHSNGSHTYDILVNAPLDYETFPEGHMITLVASDNANPPLSTSTNLMLTLQDANEPPFFPDGNTISASVQEKDPLHSHVILLQAEDPDSGSNGDLSYNITSGNELGWFSIDSQDGIVKISALVNPHVARAVTLTVTVRDNGSPPLSQNATITININDLDDHAPVFSINTAAITVPETWSPSSPLFDFNASDSDTGCSGAVWYTILNAEPQIFTIDGVSGLLYLQPQASLDYESYTMARVMVRATSQGDNPNAIADAILELNITDKDDNAPVLDPPGCPCWITENQPSPQSCPALTVHDPDGVTSSLQFIIKDGNLMGHFTINSTTGVVSTTGTLDHEVRDNYTLTIVVRDGGGHNSNEEVLRIVVVDVNDSPPVYTGPIQLLVPQDLPVGSLVGSLTAQQGDAGYNGLTHHQFAQGTISMVANTFVLDPLSGDLFLKQSGLLLGQTFSFTVTAEDLLINSQQDSTQVTVTVVGPKNVPPQFPLATDQLNIPENFINGSLVVTANASDSDAIHYAIVGGSSFFSIGSNTGGVTLIKPLAGMAGTTLTLNISATDDGTPVLTSYLLLNFTVYSSTLSLAGSQLIHNPGVGVCHYTGTVTEMTTNSSQVAVLEATLSGHVIQYTILNSEFASAFRVSGNIVSTTSGNGLVFNRATRESIFIVLRAVYSSNFHLCSLSVAISDINNNGPVFSQSSYSIQVYKNTPIGSSVFKFQTTDMDIGVNARAEYELNHTSSVFTLEGQTGILRIASSLSLSSQPHMVTVVARDAMDSSKTDMATLVITVLDTSNTPPHFSTPASAFPIAETLSSNILVSSFQATDSNHGIYGQIRYCIAAGNVFDNFLVGPDGELELSPQKRLDFETQPHTLNLMIVAYDPSPNPVTATASVTLTITDKNDEAPTFLTPIFQAAVKEGTSSNVPVLKVIAFDSDMGTNGDIQYTISPTNSRFAIDSSTGQITTKNIPIDLRSSESFIALTVLATDQGVPPMSSNATVNITILDTNGGRPQFLLPTASKAIPESTAPGTVVLTTNLQQSNLDIGLNAEARFWISSESHEGTFFLDRISGALSLTRKLDYETNPHTYSLTIQAIDLGSPQLSASPPLSVTVTLTNTNDNYPIFAKDTYYCNITEGMMEFAAPCQVNAVDADSTGNTVTYSIVRPTNSGSFFQISSAGVISVSSAPDHEMVPRYTLVIRAEDSDSSPLSSTAIVVITVQDIGDTMPVFDSTLAASLPPAAVPFITNIRVPEDTPINTLLFRAHAGDKDNNGFGQVEYSFLQPSQVFQIDSGGVYLKAQLDFETTMTYLVEILANGLGGANSQSFHISVLDVDENSEPPYFPGSSPISLEVARTIPVGTLVTTLSATDNDKGRDGIVSYYITGGSGYGYFKINITTGGIFTSFPLGGVPVNQLSLTVAAFDAGSKPMNTSYELNVVLIENPSAKPFFVSPLFKATTLGSNSGKIISYVTAQRGEQVDSNITYSVSETLSLPFTINATTGAISLSSAVDLSVTPAYNFTVEASVPGMNTTTTALVIVEVTDDTKFRPIFPNNINFNAQVFQNSPANESFTLLRVFARTVNRVENDMLTYALQTNGPFSIIPSTGNIYLTSSISSTSTYSLTVTVNDTDGFASKKNLTVTGISQASPNTHHPMFSSPSYTVNVSEDMAVGASVFTPIVTDQDSPVLFYFFAKAETTSAAFKDFAIHPNTGTIYVARTLDREELASYTINIEAWDGMHAAIQNLIVTVTDVNDHIPAFTHQTPDITFTVAENSASGSLVGTVQAQDPDENPSGFTYYFADSKDPRSKAIFIINSSGEIRASGLLDREEIPVHTLTVAVQDSGTPPFLNFTRVIVTVTDENDNPPTVVPPLPDVVISEDTMTGSHVFTVPAFDPDTNESGTVAYILLPTFSPFSINSVSGMITLTGTLDYETTTQYPITVILRNSDGMSSSTPLNITVFNVIDTTPSLTEIAVTRVQENLPANTFVTVLAASNPYPVTYSIIAGNNHTHFFIEPLSGIVRTAVPLDRETIATYSLTARGSFNTNQYTDYTFTVEVTDQNDNPPCPAGSAASFTFQVPENTNTFNTKVFHLNLTDADTGTNAQVSSVEILDPAAAAWFRISTAGDGTLTKALDREKQPFYRFEVVFIDSGTPQQSSSASITVEVTDANDNTPQFSREEYHMTVNAPVQVDNPLFSISATDRDQGIFGTVRYSFTGGNGTNKFAIEEGSGNISITDNFDLQPYYSLTAAATDGGGRQAMAPVYVSVKYCSFANLIFYPSQYNVQVPENTSIGTVFVSVNLIDFGQPGTFVYSITTPNKHFSISATTGNVSVSLQLDRETQVTHELAIQARDTSASSSRIAQANVVVTVLDVNDNSPSFAESLYAMFVADSDPMGTEVIRVSAQDPDSGSNGQISYHLLQDTSNHFSVDSFSGAVTLTRAINSANIDSSIQLLITARDGGRPPLSTNTTVIIYIVNSNAPNFSTPLYSRSISESEPKGTSITTVSATAKSNNAIIVYRIVTNDPMLPFAISDDGEITVNDIGLDYETAQSFSFNVRATDMTTSLSAQAMVHVNVLDSNDETPSFTEALYQKVVNESIQVHSYLVNVSATDRDSPPNAQLTYSLPQNNFPGLFVIDPGTGVIRTNGTLDYEMHQSYQFNVLAVDSGSPRRTGSSTVRVVLNNINDSPPSFSTVSSPSVSEGASPGTLITYIQAVDPDGDSLSYKLLPSVGYENFQVDGNGLLKLNATIVSLTEPEYDLNISASDGIHTTTVTITVNIIDVNDHSPMFNASVYNATVVENPPPGLYLTTVFATDQDRGTNAEITYTGYLDQFTVDSSTGVVTSSDCTSCSIDRETSPIYNLLVVARDGGFRTDTATVVITVLDKNDNRPTFLQSSYVASVSETVPYGTSVVQVQATDPDSGSNGSITYRFASESNSFGIDPSTGRIQTTAELNFEAVQQHTLLVVARDMGNPTLESNPAVNVTIHVVNQADTNPVFRNSSYNSSVPENSPVGTQVVQTAVIITDGCTFSEYSVVQDVPFSIDSSGSLLVSGSLDRETKDTYTFQIRVACVLLDTSQNPPRPIELNGFADVNVVIEDVNEAPEFDQTFYSDSIAENSPVNTTLTSIVLQATDDDIGNNGEVRYRIRNPESVPFAIKPASGELFLKGELDYETKKSYAFTVEAYDLGSPSLSDTVVIVVVVIDVNDSPPQFECGQNNSSSNSTCVYYRDVPENNQVGQTIITLMATDVDQASNITYIISNSPSFTINSATGEVQASQSLDREKVAHFNLTVTALDGGFSTQAILIMNITDVNDNAPVFTQDTYRVTLKENYPTGIPFTNVTATDLDITMSVVTYSILTSPFSNNVSIDPSSGWISFSVPPDREVAPTMELHLQATDGGGMTGSTTLIVTLQDENDNAPIFSMTNYTASIPEERSNSIDILHVTATDADTGSNRIIMYSLTGHGNQYFQINSATGLISSKGPVNREVNPNFLVTIIAQDLGNVSRSTNTTVNITVLDINDNPPVFNASSYEGAISENASPGATVLSGQVSDADTGINAQLLFNLVGTNKEDFQITHTNGVFSITAQMINFEVTRQYNLTLSVVDGGNPTQSASVQVTIDIQDENDNNPMFVPSVYSKTIPEDIPVQSTVLTVRATDLDTTDTIIYSFTQPMQYPEFSLNSSTGSITVARSLDFETRTDYTIQVTARNERVGALTATATVMIHLNNTNDNPPVFKCRNSLGSLQPCLRQTIRIQENRPGPIILANFTATDADNTNENAISFAIAAGGRPGVFELTPLGRLSVLTSLDREERAGYFLTVTAADNGNPSLTGTAYITIEVLDINDNGPQGGRESIFLYLYDGSANPTTVGQVSGNDPDVNNSHRITVGSQSIRGLFRVEQDGNIVTSNTHLESGDYAFPVTVTDTLFNGTILSATSTVTIVVRSITESTLANSFVMQIVGDDTLEFLTDHLLKLREEVTKILSNAIPGYHELYSFSVNRSESRPGLLEMSMAAVLRDGRYVHPDLVQHLIHEDQQQLEASVGIRIRTEDFTPCSNEPCSANGLCSSRTFYSSSSTILHTDMVTLLGLNKTWNVSCECFAGFTGQTCSEQKASCANISCSNGASCIDTDTATGCLCPHKYIGRSCEILRNPLDLCSSGTTCMNGAECTSSQSGFTCTCFSGFSGVRCENTNAGNLGGCHINPCRHGGTCVWNNDQTSFTCQCPPGYSGPSCQKELYTGTCMSSVLDDVCSCVFSTTGTTCMRISPSCTNNFCPRTASCVKENEVLSCVDDCNPNPCRNNGTCIYQSPGHFCTCPEGYEGPNCELITATFNGSSTVLFPSIPLRATEEMSLDFITEREDGLLLFAGRLDNDTTDYIALRIKDGNLNLMTSLGGAPFNPLIIVNPVSDRQWHTATITVTTKVSCNQRCSA